MHSSLNYTEDIIYIPLFFSFQCSLFSIFITIFTIITDTGELIAVPWICTQRKPKYVALLQRWDWYPHWIRYFRCVPPENRDSNSCSCSNQIMPAVSLVHKSSVAMAVTIGSSHRGSLGSQQTAMWPCCQQVQQILVPSRCCHPALRLTVRHTLLLFQLFH